MKKLLLVLTLLSSLSIWAYSDVDLSCNIYPVEAYANKSQVEIQTMHQFAYNERPSRRYLLITKTENEEVVKEVSVKFSSERECQNYVSSKQKTDEVQIADKLIEELSN